MRRLAYAAVCVSLVLAAACTDTQAPTEPSRPEPEQSFGSCRVTRFPAVKVGGLVLQVFPAGRNRVEALVRTTAVAILWDTCHPAFARQGAVLFVNWIDRNAPSSAAPAKVIALKVAILNGVGIPVPAPPPGFQDDFGVGTFDPANPNKTLIKTRSGRALVQLDPGSFLEFTVITISRKLNAFQLSDFEGRQFPPKYDYDAVNASGKKVLEAGKTAIVAFCLLGLDDVAFPGGYPAHPRIGHNPVQGPPGFDPFEVLDEVDLDDEDLDDDLSPALCGHDPVPGPIGRFGRTPLGYANAALRMAERYLSPILLPKTLSAAALAELKPPPPIGGRAPSLSPFGVVEVEVEGPLSTTTHITEDSPDPSGPDEEYTVSFSVTTSSEDTPTGNVVVTDENEGSCTASVDAGSCVMPPGPLGTHTLTAEYQGNSSFASSSDTESHTVTAPPITFASDPTWSESQYVCLNPSIPANCPEGATVYTSVTTGWGADLSSIPGAFWIWSAGVTPVTSPAYPAEFSFSKSFSLSESQLEGSISVAADDYAQVAVNGEVVGEIGSRTDGALAGEAQNSLTTFDLGSFLAPGTNLITVRGANGTFGCGAGPYSCNPAGVVFGGWLGSAP